MVVSHIIYFSLPCFCVLTMGKNAALSRDVNQLGKTVILTVGKKWMEVKCPVNNYF